MSRLFPTSLNQHTPCLVYHLANCLGIRSVENKETSDMGNLLYIIAVILVIGWLLGVFVYSATGLIHTLLVIAVIAILLQLIRGRKIS